MNEINLEQLVNKASDDELQEIADEACNGSVDHLKYQLAAGRRDMSHKVAKKIRSKALDLGYNVPLKLLRPDIWGETA